MGIQRIFVSHAGKDAGAATELAQQLRNVSHDARIDTRDLALGDNAIEFMNEGISNAAAVIILFPSTASRRSGQKLELYLLEDVLPFKVKDLRDRFVGTERGRLLEAVPRESIERDFALVPALRELSDGAPRQCAVVHRYSYDMGNAFETIKGACLSGDRVRRRPDRRREDLYLAGPADDSRRKGLSTCRPIQ